MDIKTQLLAGNKRAAARLITMVENGEDEGISILKELYFKSGNARIIGITGPPGAGKSTLTDKLVKHARKQGKKVGVIAVDPTSPFTGGAILGDRVRMSDLNTDPGVFIRSMGTRGALGGLSNAAHGAVKVLDIFGVDYIFIETVGVGQSEIDIVKLADTVIMVMVPGLGDDIQAIKAGIMEIGDIFAVNKSDREGADKTVIELNAMLDLNNDKDYRPPVLKVIAKENKGIGDIFKALEEHYIYMKNSGNFDRRRRKIAKEEIMSIIKENVVKSIIRLENDTNYIDNTVAKVVSKNLDPYTAAEMLIDKITK